MEVSNNFKIPRVTYDAFKLIFFPYSLRDKAKIWLNSLAANFIATWNDLDEKFLYNYFSPVKNTKMRKEITSFRKWEDESLFDAYERFK